MEQVLQIPSELYGRKKWSYLELRLSFLKLLNNKNFYIELVSSLFHYLIKNTLKEKAPSNKTSTLSKSMNVDISMVATSNQIFIQGS